jgi:hypothetical protein
VAAVVLFNGALEAARFRAQALELVLHARVLRWMSSDK